MPITVPPPRGIGDTGHVNDSNLVRQALLDLDAQKAAPPEWTDYAPTVSNVTGATAIGRKTTIGGTTIAAFRVEFGASTAVTGEIVVSLPTSPAPALNNFRLVTSIVGRDASAGADYPLSAIGYGNSLYIKAMAASGPHVVTAGTSAAVPFAWGPGDYIIGMDIYEG